MNFKLHQPTYECYDWLIIKRKYFIRSSNNKTCSYEDWKWKSLSCVQLFATPWIIQPMEFSRPEY